MREIPEGQEPLPLPFVRGTWVRISQSKKGHKVGKSLIESVCGMALDPEYQGFFPYPFDWIVEDLRKASHCGRCNGKDFSIAPNDASY